MRVLSALVGTAMLAGAWPALAARVVDQGPSFVVIEDDTGELDRSDWYRWPTFLQGFRVLHDGYYATQPDSIEILIVYQTFPLRGASGFYQPVANDVSGLGFGHQVALEQVPAEIFDATPATRLAGVINMGAYTGYLDRPDRISVIFNQEMGHAASAYVTFMRDGSPSTALLGRDLAHWSFYLDTDGSALEGNDWIDNGDGTFTTATRRPLRYSDLDLYLMGLIPAGEVRPFFLIEDPAAPPGSAAAVPPPWMGPALGAPVTVAGRRREVTVDEVIAAEGPRLPAHVPGTRELHVGFALVTRAGEAVSAAEKNRLAQLIVRTRCEWEAAVRGLAVMAIETGDGSAIAPGADGSGCRVGGADERTRPPGRDFLAVATAAALVVLLRRRRR